MKQTHISRGLIVLAALMLTLAAVYMVGAQDNDALAGQPFLGVRLNSTADGVSIVDVLPESPAAQAELQIDDLITGVNGTDVSSARDVVELIRELAPGDLVSLDITRDGETLTVEATLGTLSQFTPNVRGERFGFPLMPTNGRLGVAFEPLTAELSAELNLDITEGALIREVATGSAAETAGLQVDDVVTAVNDEPVDAERTLRDRLIAYEPGDTVTLTLLRAGESLDISVTLTQPEFADMMGVMPHMGPIGPMDMDGMGMPGYPHPRPHQDGGV